MVSPPNLFLLRDGGENTIKISPNPMKLGIKKFLIYNKLHATAATVTGAQTTSRK
jgi:hypothetical protein